MPLMNLKLGNKENYNAIDHLFENYAAVVAGSTFPKHAAIKFGGTTKEMTCDIVNAANKDEVIESFTHDKIKCATVIGWGELFVNANLLLAGTTASSSGTSPCTMIKYLVVFTDGRQATLTCRLAESALRIEQILF